MHGTEAMLAAYDAQLRGEPETTGAERSWALGPLRLAVFRGGRGFITSAGTAADAAGLVGEALASIAADAAVREVEWKTRAHDRAPGLHDALAAAGFVPGEPESIMIGPAEPLAVDLPVPTGVRLRQVADPADVRRASAAADRFFGGSPDAGRAADLPDRVALGTELWVAEADGAVVCTGRLEPVAGTAFAGLWGGATDPAWRGRGIYRALTAARARSAIRRGCRWLTSDSTEGSRPVLERSGLTKVSETTPYEWRR